MRPLHDPIREIIAKFYPKPEANFGPGQQIYHSLNDQEVG